METKKLSKEKTMDLLKELAFRKMTENTKLSIESKGGDVIGNTSSCTDKPCDNGGGGSGNNFACDDSNCHPPGGNSGTAGNQSSCGDWYCGD